MSSFACWSLSLLILFYSPGSGEKAFEVYIWSEKQIVEATESWKINCSTNCAAPDMGGLETSAQHRVLAPKGQSWSLGSAIACWQGQGNAIRPWEKASCPSLPTLCVWGIVRSQESECPGVGTVLPLASHNVPPKSVGGLAEAIGGCRGCAGGRH